MLGALRMGYPGVRGCQAHVHKAKARHTQGGQEGICNTQRQAEVHA